METKEKKLKLAEIKKILALFEKENINYIVLRNYDFLEGHSDKLKDLDILINSKDLKKSFKIFISENYKKRNEIFFKYLGCGVLLKFHPRSEKDFLEHQIYEDNQVIFHNKVKKGFYYKFSNEDYLLNLITHTFIGKRKLQDKYLPIYNELIKSKLDLDYIKKILTRGFGEKISSEILKKIKEEKLKELNINRYFHKFLLKKPSRFLTYSKLVLIKKYNRYKRIFHFEPFIAIIGIDGSGKSTITNKISKILTKGGFKNSRVYFGRTKKNILPLDFLRKKYHNYKPSLNTSSKIKEVGLKKKIIYSIAAIAISFDFLLRYFINIFPNRAIFKRIVISDRYSSDIFIIKNLSLRFKKLLYFFMPKASKIYYLDCPIDLLQKRNPEHNSEDLKLQKEVFRKIENEINLIKIENKNINMTIDKIFFDLYKII